MQLQAIFSGRVQGVGFRVTVRHLATNAHLTGMVRNLPNGSVELIAEGTKEKLENLLKDIQKAFPGYIDSIQKKIVERETSYIDFLIS